MWLKDHGIKAFFTASQNKSFSDGAISCMNLAGLGKLTPNMVLMGFKVQIWHQSVFYLCLTAKDCFSPFLLVHDSVWDALCFASGWLGVWSWGSRGVHQRDASCIWHQHGHGGTKVRLVHGLVEFNNVSSILSMLCVSILIFSQILLNAVHFLFFLRMSNGCDFSSVIGREEQIFIGANDNAG